MIKRLFFGFIALSFTISIITPGSKALASSLYDSNYTTTDTLTVGSTSSVPGIASCNDTDITASWTSYMTDSSKWPANLAPYYVDLYSTTRASFLSAVNDSVNGSWAVSQSYLNTTNSEYSGYVKSVAIFWTQDPNAKLDWTLYGNTVTLSSPDSTLNRAIITCSGTPGSAKPAVREIDAPHSDYRNYSTSLTTPTSSYGVQYSSNFITHNFDENLPAGYQGAAIINTIPDTDEDGLSDYLESSSYPNRDDMFCNKMTSPYTCAYPDPVKKDVYVEIDWMDDGTKDYKPSATQLNLVKNMFSAKNINLHIDTGQYGGGNELSTYTQALKRVATTGQVDFWDYKDGGDGLTANFAANRKNIWRYMIYGNDYDGSNGSSGWARVMGDDIFISGGVIENMTGLASTDRAIANTIAHEIGHSLCLSNQKIYQEQPPECVYGGIDNDDSNSAHYNLSDYESVMNYRYQLTDIDDLGIVNYSDGSRVLNDHNDWSAVLAGMNGFSGTKTALGAKQLDERYTVMPDGGVIVDEAPIAEIRRANQEKPAYLYQKHESVTSLDSNVLGSQLAGSNTMNSVSAKVSKKDDSSNSDSQGLHSAIGLGVFVLSGVGFVIYRRLHK